MLSHSASSDSRQTGSLARLYQYAALPRIAFLPVQVGVHPRTIAAFILLSRFVRSRPVAFGIPP